MSMVKDERRLSSGRCAAVVVFLTAMFGSAGTEFDGRALYASVCRASVSILVNGQNYGSGFFAGSNGLIVLTAHQLKNVSGTVEVRSPQVGRIPVRQIAVDPGHDLALLRAPARKAPYPSLPVAGEVPSPGSDVFLFGEPIFRHRLLIRGFIATGAPTFVYNSDTECYTRVHLITGTSPQGTSGGCWVNARGEVIGVQSAYLNAPDAPSGLAVACVPEAIRDLVVSGASPGVTTLGARMEELWTQRADFIARYPKGVEGVVVVLTRDGGALDRAGIGAEALIRAVDGRRMAYLDELLVIVREKKPGDRVMVDVMAPETGREQTREVTLDAVPMTGFVPAAESR